MSFSKNNLKGRTFRAIAILEANEFAGLPFTLENREAIAAEMIKQIAAQGGEAYVQGDNVNVKGSGQYFRLPMIPARREGVLVFAKTAGKYTFSCPDFHNNAPSHGTIAELDTEGFAISTPNGRLVYRLIEELK